MRDLPAIDTFADEIILALGEGEKRMLAEGDWPVAAIAIAQRCILLIRDHRHSITISLPTNQSWPIAARREWLALAAEIKHAVADYRRQYPQSLSLADAVLTLNLRDWSPDFPGTPVPAEAWLKKRDEPRLSIGLFQEAQSVRIVVWVGDDMRSRMLTTAAHLETLQFWLASQIVDQRKAEERRAAEEARRRALPLPDISEVMARLEAGEKLSTGGGRYSETYFVENGKLRCEVFDEGHCEVFDATRKQLQQSIEFHPDRFRKES